MKKPKQPLKQKKQSCLCDHKILYHVDLRPRDEAPPDFQPHTALVLFCCKQAMQLTVGTQKRTG